MPRTACDLRCSIYVGAHGGAGARCGSPASWVADGGYLRRPVPVCDACRAHIRRQERNFRVHCHFTPVEEGDRC